MCIACITRTRYLLTLKNKRGAMSVRVRSGRTKDGLWSVLQISLQLACRTLGLITGKKRFFYLKLNIKSILLYVVISNYLN